MKKLLLIPIILGSVLLSYAQSNSSAAFTLSKESITISEKLIPGSESNSSTVLVTLNSQPNSDVIITLDYSDETEFTVSPTTATITSSNWNTPQTFTFTAIDDDIVDDDVTISVDFISTTTSAHDSGSGDGSHDSGSGDGSHDSGSGDGSHDSGSGDGSHDSGSGDGSHDSGSGDGSHDSGSGDGSHDSGSGDGSHDSGSGDGSHDSGSGDGSHDSGSGDGSHDSGSGDGSSDVETYTSTLTVIVKDDDTGTLGLADVNLADAIVVYPNPTDGILNISGVEKVDAVRAFSISGQLIKEAVNANSLDLSTERKGLYMIEIEHEGQTTVNKLILR